MKRIIAIILSIIFSFILGQFLPWWSIVLSPFIMGYFLDIKLGQQLLIGFLTIFILWTSIALIANQTNAMRLAPMIGELFGSLHPFFLIILTGTIGGIYGALSQISGHLLKKSIRS